jgi:(2Fe-2S) ferredoxin
MADLKSKNLYECHVFVCTNKREKGRESCGTKGSEELRSQLKAWAFQKYGKKVRINTSGCLDFCEKGIVTVIYPAGEWHMNLTTDSLEELKKAISEKMDL